MKAGWKSKRIGELGSAERESAQIFANAEYELWSVPSFASDKPEITLGKDIGSAKLRVHPKDVLICKINPRINRVWLVRDPVDDRIQIASTEWLVFRTNRDMGLLPDWLIHFVSAPKFREWIVSEVSGATGSHTRAKTDLILHQQIPVPPLPEQQRIVGILDEVFQGIATAKAHAEKNLQNARAIFQSHLQSIFTQRGPGWDEKRLSEVSDEFGRGKSKHRPRNDPKLYGGHYPFVQTGDISNADHWLTTYSQTYNDVGLAQSRLWPKGTICVAIVGATVGETAILDFEACFPDSVIGIVVNEQIADNEYVEYLLQAFKSLLKEKGKGTARDNINLGTFEHQRFPFPSLKLQKHIVATLSSLRDETQQLASVYERKLVELEDLKRSFLHQAFTGKL